MCTKMHKHTEHSLSWRDVKLNRVRLSHVQPVKFAFQVLQLQLNCECMAVECFTSTVEL